MPGITAPDRCADGRGGYVEPVGVGRQLTLIAVNLGVVGPGPGRTRSVWVFGVDPSAPTELGGESLGSSGGIGEHPGGIGVGGVEESGGVGGELDKMGELGCGHGVDGTLRQCWASHLLLSDCSRRRQTHPAIVVRREMSTYRWVQKRSR